MLCNLPRESCKVHSVLCNVGIGQIYTTSIKNYFLVHEYVQCWYALTSTDIACWSIDNTCFRCGRESLSDQFLSVIFPYLISCVLMVSDWLLTVKQLLHFQKFYLTIGPTDGPTNGQSHMHVWFASGSQKLQLYILICYLSPVIHLWISKQSQLLFFCDQDTDYLHYTLPISRLVGLSVFRLICPSVHP